MSLSNKRVVFAILLVSHSIAALKSPIQDCDETFNFWEPSHYLNHGYGMQTWELSPEYAIRSWLYASLHALAMSLVTLIVPSSTKSTQFYSLRILLGFVSAACETRLFSAVSRSMNRRIALLFLVVCSSTAGMFHATVSYLPSSFAMYTTTLALADFMDWHGGIKTSRGLTWLGFGALIGWPFVAVLSVPFVLEELVVSWMNRTMNAGLERLMDGIAQSLLILIFQMSVDSFFYRNITSVPFNIIRYNVLSPSGEGPGIYGTEPWHFYVRNLLINFNLWFILACISLPVLLLHHAFQNRSPSRLTFFRTLVFLSPFYFWLLIFTLQPHKEERFMYPIYPCLALNAAVSLHILILNFHNTSVKSPMAYIPSGLKLFLVVGTVVLAVVMGIWRIAGLTTAYTAPLTIYRGLHSHPVVAQNPDVIVHVCLGKEWFRFPSSYHIPSNVRLKFIKSEFNGLLPGAFIESNGTSGLYAGASLLPNGMNDRNIEDPGKHSELNKCDFLVDSAFPGRELSRLEPDFVNDREGWEKVECMRFLDTERTRLPGRLFWIPDSNLISSEWRRKWGEYCLLSRKRH